jgi:hypothetical protein
MAKTGKFKCSACGRSFGMAAHLGRHMTTVHASKAKRTAPMTKTKRAKRTPTTMSLGAADGLVPVVQEIQTHRDKLAGDRAFLDRQIALLDQTLVDLGAVAPARKAPSGRGRRGASYRSGSLKVHIQQVLQAQGGPMAVKDITVAVRKSGYKTKNKTLDKSVGNALADMRNVAKISRGVFRAK